MSDVLLFQTPDDGDVSIDGGEFQLTDGLETAVYLSLFGGNWQDDGAEGNPLQWWGNSGVVDPDQRQRSRTQYLLQSLPATSGNLKRVEDAAVADLAWLPDQYAVTISTSMPARNKVQFVVQINDTTVTLLEDWER